MDEKAVIVEYLKKCNSYAEASIARKEERGEVEEIPSWRSYIEFNEHAIEELGNGKLDAWFTPAPTHSLKQATRLDLTTHNFYWREFGQIRTLIPTSYASSTEITSCYLPTTAHQLSRLVAPYGTPQKNALWLSA